MIPRISERLPLSRGAGIPIQPGQRTTRCPGFPFLPDGRASTPGLSTAFASLSNGGGTKDGSLLAPFVALPGRSLADPTVRHRAALCGCPLRPSSATIMPGVTGAKLPLPWWPSSVVTGPRPALRARLTWSGSPLLRAASPWLKPAASCGRATLARLHCPRIGHSIAPWTPPPGGSWSAFTLPAKRPSRPKSDLRISCGVGNEPLPHSP